MQRTTFLLNFFKNQVNIQHMKLIKTKMLKHYLLKLCLRITIFISVFLLYLYDKELMIQLALQPIYMGINAFHILWLFFMFIMFTHLFPKGTLLSYCELH